MPLLARLDWCNRQLDARHMHITVSAARTPGTIKVKIVLHATSVPPMSPLVVGTMRQQLQRIRQMARNLTAVDRGHRYSSGVSEVCLWLSPPDIASRTHADKWWPSAVATATGEEEPVKESRGSQTCLKTAESDGSEEEADDEDEENKKQVHEGDADMCGNKAAAQPETAQGLTRLEILEAKLRDTAAKLKQLVASIRNSVEQTSSEEGDSSNEETAATSSDDEGSEEDKKRLLQELQSKKEHCLERCWELQQSMLKRVPRELHEVQMEHADEYGRMRQEYMQHHWEKQHLKESAVT